MSDPTGVQSSAREREWSLLPELAKSNNLRVRKQQWVLGTAGNLVSESQLKCCRPLNSLPKSNPNNRRPVAGSLLSVIYELFLRQTR
jgi:hypothetical protein